MIGLVVRPVVGITDAATDVLNGIRGDANAASDALRPQLPEGAAAESEQRARARARRTPRARAARAAAASARERARVQFGMRQPRRYVRALYGCERALRDYEVEDARALALLNAVTARYRLPVRRGFRVAQIASPEVHAPASDALARASAPAVDGAPRGAAAPAEGGRAFAEGRAAGADAVGGAEQPELELIHDDETEDIDEGFVGHVDLGHGGIALVSTARLVVLAEDGALTHHERLDEIAAVEVETVDASRLRGPSLEPPATAAATPSPPPPHVATPPIGPSPARPTYTLVRLHLFDVSAPMSEYAHDGMLPSVAHFPIASEVSAPRSRPRNGRGVSARQPRLVSPPRSRTPNKKLLMAIHTRVYVELLRGGCDCGAECRAASPPPLRAVALTPPTFSHTTVLHDRF